MPRNVVAITRTTELVCARSLIQPPHQSGAVVKHSSEQAPELRPTHAPRRNNDHDSNGCILPSTTTCSYARGMRLVQRGHLAWLTTRLNVALCSTALQLAACSSDPPANSADVDPTDSSGTFTSASNATV